MKLTKEKQEALWIVVIALVLHAVSWHLIKSTYGYKTYGTYEGSGVLLGTVGLIVWFYGFIKYARAKGCSELLAIVLSLFWILGLIVMLLLPDAKTSKKRP